MSIRNRIAVAIIGFAMLATVPARSQESTLADAIASGKANLDLRYRFETVDQDSFDNKAYASTLRLRLNYATAEWRAWSGFVEFDQVIEVLADNFNSGSGTSGPRRDRYPVVADPDGPDLNQAYLQFSDSDSIRARIGRQRILLDDQRFVGGVGWRQNEQTYDALSVNYDGAGSLDVFYSYVTNVNRIFGREVAAGDHRQKTHLLNAAARLTDVWKWVGYAYLIDNEDAPAFSTRTIGMRLSGALQVGDGKLDLLAEYADQADSANNPANFNVDYFRLQADWALDRLSAGIGVESLGSDDGESFRTPLATLHAFNGWADQFLTTPADGLEDLYLKLGFAPGQWNLQLVYHEFSAKSGNSDFGNELDVSAARKLGDRYALLLKLAAFDADATAAFADTTKIWVMLSATY